MTVLGTGAHLNIGKTACGRIPREKLAVLPQ